MKKLLSYDFKDLLKKMIIYWIILLLAACFTRLFVYLSSITSLQNNQIAVSFLTTFTTLFTMTTILGSIALPFFVSCISAVRFKKILCSDHAYLWHTLPVKTSHLILSKYIAGLVLSLTTAFILLAVFFIAVPFDTAVQLFTAFINSLGEGLVISPGFTIPLLIGVVLYLIVSPLVTMGILFSGIAMASSFNNNKTLYMILLWVALSTGVQFVNGILLSFTYMPVLFSQVVAIIQGYIACLPYIMVVLDVAWGVGSYFLCYHYLTKRLALE